MLRLQAAITIISHDRVLEGAAAVFRSRPLSNVRNLVARVVGVDRRRIDAAVFPIEDFGLYRAAEHVVIDSLLTFFRNPAIYRAFIGERDHFAARAATAGVTWALRSAVGVRGNEWPAFPIVGLLRVIPAGGVISKCLPTRGHLRRV